jgi:RimJ/RimL family protein N-acetyltransferase
LPTALDCGLCIVRTYRKKDAEPLQRLADDWEVARYLRDGFPHPYTAKHAREWVKMTADPRSTHFAVEVDGAFAGGIGYVRFDAERQLSGEIGYWLGRPFWGRGIATAALRSVAGLAFERETGVLRLEAPVFSNNPRSARVLEKCGFVREGVLRRAVVKRDEILDVVMYAKIRD